ncbi:leucine rich repeat [Physocladia obscura]|uniref:Leucine rich repeat n=1 Tax=Physocladia obscura TaxID=109957 RepID=A0AAD5SNR6_9FUNG|nr:leucine rich repeat [Physocladia obscura]
MVQTELQYRTEIVSLSDRLSFALKTIDNEKSQRILLEEKINSLQESERLKSENHILMQRNLESQLQQSENQKALLESSEQRFKSELESSKAVLEQLQESLKTLEGTAANWTEKNKTLSEGIARDREMFEMKTNELKNEILGLKSEIKKLQKNKYALEDAIRQVDTDWKIQYAELKSAYEQELAEQLAKTTKTLVESHENEKEKFAKMLANSKRNYDALETEFRKSITEFQALSEERNSLSNTLKEYTSSEHELRLIARELTNVIKEQKFKIVELSNKNEASFAIFEEKCQAMESQVKILTNAKSDLEGTKQELSTYKTEILKNQKTIGDLEMEITAAISFQKERDLLLKRVEDLEKEIQIRLTSQNEAEQALRIKNKMLDDQNDTIKSLKQNLENKIREHASLFQEISLNESKIEESVARERKKTRELSNELAIQEETFEQLQIAFQECKDERDTLHSELMEVSKKLQERNISIGRIEEEVSRAKDIFSAKEKKFHQDRDDILKSKEIAIDDIKRFYEAQSSRLKILEHERDSLYETTKRLKTHEIEMEATLKSQNDEMKKLQQELERQKIKFIKLKEAIDF